MLDYLVVVVVVEGRIGVAVGPQKEEVDMPLLDPLWAEVGSVAVGLVGVGHNAVAGQEEGIPHCHPEALYKSQQSPDVTRLSRSACKRGTDMLGQHNCSSSRMCLSDPSRLKFMRHPS